MYEQDLALNKLQWLIYPKPNQTKLNLHKFENNPRIININKSYCIRKLSLINRRKKGDTKSLYKECVCVSVCEEIFSAYILTYQGDECL